MNQYAIESFISFCDDMMIAEEGLRELGNVTMLSLKKMAIKIKHLIRNLFYTLKKIKKIYLPKKIEPILQTELERLYTIKNDFLCTVDIDDMVMFINNENGKKVENVRSIINSLKNEEYCKLEFKLLDSKILIDDLKHADNMLKKSELIYAELESGKDADPLYSKDQSIICKFSLNLANQICNTILMFFEWNDIYNKASDEIILKHGGKATYDSPTNY